MSHPQPLSLSVAANVRAEMAAQKRTPDELAELLEIGYEAARRRLNDVVDISLNELAQIAVWLDVPVSTLMAQRPLAVSA